MGARFSTRQIDPLVPDQMRPLDLPINFPPATGEDAAKRSITDVTRLGDAAAASFHGMGRAMSVSARESASVSQQEQRDINAVFQMNQRMWALRKAEEKKASDERARLSNNTLRMVESAAKKAADTEIREAKRAATEIERVRTRQTTSASMLAGGGNTYALSGLMGGGLGGAIGGMALGVGVQGIATFLQDQMAAAQALKNTAAEFGTTTSKIFQFQAAAKLAGIDSENFAQSLRKISIGLEDPGGAGKKAAEVMLKLGVSLREGPGQALEDLLRSLNAVKDPAQQAAEATAVFGKNFGVFLEMARNLDTVGAKMDDNVTAKLVAANKELEAFSIKWQVLKASIATGVLGVIKIIATPGEQQNQLSTAAGVIYQNAAKRGYLGPEAFLNSSPRTSFAVTTGPQQAAGDPSSLLRTMGAASKRSIQERLAENTHLLGQAEMLGRSDAAKHKPQDKLNQDQADYLKYQAEDVRLRAEEKALTAKPSTKNASAVHAEESYLTQLRDRKLLQNNPGRFRPIGELQMQQANRLAQINNDTALTPAQRHHYTSVFTDIYRGDMAEAQKGVDLKGDEVTNNFNREASKILREGQVVDGVRTQYGLGDSKPYRLKLAESLKDYQKEQSLLRGDVQSGIHLQGGFVTRQARLQSSMRGMNGTETPGNAYSDSMAEANQLLALRQRGIAMEDDSDRRHSDSIHAQYEYIEQQDEARIKRTEEIAKIGHEQSKEAGSFFSGLVNASLSHQPGATGNYLRGFGQQQFSKIVSNTASALLPNGLNGFASLGPTGLMGNPNNPNFLGKMFAGTPASFSAKELANANPLQAATTSNTDATIANTGVMLAMLSASGVDTSSFAGLASGGSAKGGSGGGGGPRGFSIPGIPSHLSSAIPNIVHAAASGNPMAMIQSAMSLASGSSGGGGSAGGGYGGGGSFPSGGFSSAPVSSSDLVGSMAMANLPKAPDFVSRFSQNMGKLSHIIGTSTKDVMSGHALGGIASGKIDFGNGTASTVSGPQRAADTIGLGIAGYEGISTAAKDFSRGGGRGISGGIGSTLSTAAMFDPEPFSHALLQGAGEIASLVSSLFGDPRQERINQMSRRMVEDQMVDPQSHSYNFSATNGRQGFTGGLGGGSTSGGDITQNHYWMQHPMSQKDLYDMIRSDPARFNSLIEQSLTSGSAQQLASTLAFQTQYGGV